MMKLEEHPLLKASRISGVLAPIIAFSCILTAISTAKEFSWTENALSDLGVQEGVTATVFNCGLITAGILGLIFALGLFVFLRRSLLGKTGSFLFILDTLFLACIGVFPENAEPAHIHFYFSVLFFVFFPISAFVSTATFIQMGRKKLGLFTILIALISAFVWTIPFGKGVAIPETITALSVSAWTMTLSVKLMEKASLNN